MTTIPPSALEPPGIEGGRGLDAADLERIASIRQRIKTTSPFSALFSDLAWLVKLVDRAFGAADAALKAAEAAHRDAAEDRAKAAAEIVTLRTERDEARERAACTTERLRARARGCLDYLGGYTSSERDLEIFHHGIQTVINALQGDDDDTQTRALERMGRERF